MSTEDEAEITAIDALIAEAGRGTVEAIAVILGPIPAWVPLPVVERAWRQASRLLAEGTTPQRIRRLIDEILSGADIDTPASLPLPLIRSMHELASFVYGASLGESDGLRFLAGERAVIGQKFSKGRKAGARGAIRMAVERQLSRLPDMTTKELWGAISKKPPNGWKACDNNQGKYLEGRAGKNVNYRSFQNICSKARKIID